MIWHRAAAKPFRPDSAVLVRPPSSKQHVTLATRRLAGANNGPFNQRGPRSIVAVGFPDKSARLLRLAGVGCLGRREQEKDGKRRRGGLGGVGGARDVVICGLQIPQPAGEIFQQIMDHYAGIRALLRNQQPQLGRGV